LAQGGRDQSAMRDIRIISGIFGDAGTSSGFTKIMPGQNKISCTALGQCYFNGVRERTGEERRIGGFRCCRCTGTRRPSPTQLFWLNLRHLTSIADVLSHCARHIQNVVILVFFIAESLGAAYLAG
jgi:hypothetical protein